MKKLESLAIGIICLIWGIILGGIASFVVLNHVYSSQPVPTPLAIVQEVTRIVTLPAPSPQIVIQEVTRVVEVPVYTPPPTATPRVIVVTATPTPKPAPTPTPSGMGGIGTPVQNEGFVFTVLDVEKSKKIERNMSKATAQGIFIVLHIGVRNDAGETREVQSRCFQLVDGEGRKFDVSDDARWVFIGNDLEYEQVHPGLSIEGYIAFDVPQDAHDFTLMVDGKPSPFDKAEPSPIGLGF